MPKSKLSKCSSCREYIVWMKTERGAWMPVDPDSVTDGDEIFDPDEHISHFSTCPNADEHRKRRSRK